MLHKKAQHFAAIFGFLLPVLGLNSQTGWLQGIVADSLNKPIPLATVVLENGAYVAVNDAGFYRIEMKANLPQLVTFKAYNYKTSALRVAVKPNENKRLDVRLNLQSLKEYRLEERRKEDLSIVEIEVQDVQAMPVPGDALVALIRQQGIGVAAGNELSSGYSVRGGNYDENLTYVNGMEVYRPFLARSGQQEGLSFVNPDMVESIEFSAGGFEARFGDKMSSVLNVAYRKPTLFRADAALGFLGGSLHVEDAIFHNRLKYNIGYRYKSNNYLLSGLDTRGDYQPVFQDVQAFLAYDPHEDWEISFFGSFSDNNYRVIPENRQTQFGHIQEAKQLNVYFDGQESTRFQVGSGALNLKWSPGNSEHRAYVNSFRTIEEENFDVQGQYFLGEIENDLGSPNFGEVVNTTGYGTFLNHARNRMEGQVWAWGYAGEHRAKSKRLEFVGLWGAEYRREHIQDRLSEWSLLDSSGYLLPFNGPADLNGMELDEVRNTSSTLQSQRIQSYIQSRTKFLLPDSSSLLLSAGLRAHWWDYNQQLLLSPRMQLGFRPNWKNAFLFRLSGGLYYQAPFYRELRDLDGVLQQGVKAQQSWHAVIGMDYQFKWWGRPFKLTAEAYYKPLFDLNPYKIDNVRIRYLANNMAQGYATGLDVKLNGEFIPGLDSYVSLGILNTMEDLDGDQGIGPGGNPVEYGFLPRPTDQLLNVGVFFQDELPGLERFRVHLNLLFGSQLPFGPPSDLRAADTLRSPFYRRVDIGFSFVFLDANRPKVHQSHIRTFWASLEFFNLLDINNTISYLWIRDVSGRRYAVPNYLTPRLINLKLVLQLK
ncbi:MAG: TonB-dependent receptor [Bacteroidetes bacterium]|jgi:hypothetical protein|nr:TonB-dependent receptor [Bacteroidota bacterium]MDA0930465.1 TonB-dependent receptor [Bacteroidota bacterium]